MSIYIDDLENSLYDDSLNSIEGSEEREEYPAKSETKYPFDPRKIKITVANPTIYNLAVRIKRKGIDLYPDFQRVGNLWKPEAQSRLIESLLLRFPLPAFYFDVEQNEEDEDGKWLVVDGLQRLSTIKNFIVDNTLKLEGLEILKDYEGCTFKDFDATLRRRILETNITAFLIQPGTPKNVKYNIFRRINSGGIPLNSMEIRHALNQVGKSGWFLKNLTEDSDSFFKQFLEQNKIKAIRMEDRELLLRYFAFILIPYHLYRPSLSDFLDKAMEELDKLPKEVCENWIHKLQKAMSIYERLFDSKRFGRTLTNRCRLNSALFEVWTSSLASLNEEQQQLLLDKKNNIKTKYQELLNDKLFQDSFMLRTSNKTAVETRFTKINTLIQSFLND